MCRTGTSKNNVTPYHARTQLFLHVGVRALWRRQKIRCFVILSPLREEILEQQRREHVHSKCSSCSSLLVFIGSRFRRNTTMYHHDSFYRITIKTSYCTFLFHKNRFYFGLILFDKTSPYFYTCCNKKIHVYIKTWGSFIQLYQAKVESILIK